MWCAMWTYNLMHPNLKRYELVISRRDLKRKGEKGRKKM